MSVRPVVVDADSFLAIRSLGLFPELVGGLSKRTRILLTGYVAHHELSDVYQDVQALVADGVLSIEEVVKGSDAYTRYRSFKERKKQREPDMRMVDLGEMECVAWAVGQPVPPVFVTCDSGARAFATRHRVPSTDVFGLGAAAVRLNLLGRELFADRVSPWDSPAQFTCKPAGYGGFEDEFEARAQSEQFLLDTRQDV